MARPTVSAALLLTTVLTICQSTDPPEEELRDNKDIQREVAQNIINLEKSNCNYVLSEDEIEHLQRDSKWRYMYSFLGHKFTCKRFAHMDLKIDGLIPEDYVVLCPGTITGFTDRPAWAMTLLTNEYLLSRGVFFRIGGNIVVPGEGTRPVSQDWENGTKRQLEQRQEIGKNICDWYNSRPVLFCFSKKAKAKCDCMWNIAMIYYLHIYSPSGAVSKECSWGDMVDLRLSKPCAVMCPDTFDLHKFVDFPFTNANTHNVPEDCIDKRSWMNKLFHSLEG